MRIENRYNKLAINTFIFFIGNLGSKLISFLIVPFYTYLLTTQEYGTLDLIITTISLIVPLIILSIHESTLRFLVGKEFDSHTIATNCFIIYLSGIIFSILLYPIYISIPTIKEYTVIFIIYLNIMSFNYIYQQFLRGINKNFEYAINGIIVTIVTVLMNVIFLLYLKLGILGYLLSLVIAQLISAIYIIYSARLWKYISLNKISLNKLLIMITYSIPLIPNNLMWWIMNTGDRYLITMYEGSAANGIYAVAYKLPTIINIFYSIFMQAWQISAIEVEDSDIKDNFYSTIFKCIYLILIISCSLIIICTKPLFEFVLNQEYIIAWKCVPILLIANIFSCFSSFLGTIYIATKQSKRAFSTTFISAILNIIFNILLIPNLGIIGAGIATFISFFLTTLIRLKDTRGLVKIKFNYLTLLISFILLFMQMLILLLREKVGIEQIIIFIALLCTFKNDIFDLYSNLFKNYLNRFLANIRNAK